MEKISAEKIGPDYDGILLEDVSYTYDIGLPQETLAVENIKLEIKAGSHIAILGHNGSGKSTLAHLINALLIPQKGMIHVFGHQPADEKSIWEIRKNCGLVLQNPDNQIVGTTLEEDVAFGPENLGVKMPELRERVDFSLKKVGLLDLAQRPPHNISGGQKQKLAIAGILAMQPICLILDEATAMLDPASRSDFFELVLSLRAERALTVVNITHNMEEALLADYIYVVYNGKIALQGTPTEVFDQMSLLRQMELDLPVHMEIAEKVAAASKLPLAPAEAFTLSGAVEAIDKRLKEIEILPKKEEISSDLLAKDKRVLLEVKNLSYSYNAGTPQMVRALTDLSIEIFAGELLGLAGHSGSGKTTFVEHLNGLIRPEPGVVKVMGLDVHEKKNIRKVREHLGLLFQYPEQQLFEETVAADIAFGPKQMGLFPEEIERRVKEAADLTGLDQSILSRSPFDLSGGQMRRAAIAGILAMNPDILVLDEPTAGLDPAGRDELLNYIVRLRDKGQTIILITHDMDQLAGIADRILVLKEGREHLLGTPAEVFSDLEKIAAAGLEMPRIRVFLAEMKKRCPDLSLDIFSSEEAARALISAYSGGGGLCQGK